MEFLKGGVKRSKVVLKRRGDNWGLNSRRRRGCRGLIERERV